MRLAASRSTGGVSPVWDVGAVQAVVPPAAAVVAVSVGSKRCKAAVRSSAAMRGVAGRGSQPCRRREGRCDTRRVGRWGTPVVGRADVLVAVSAWSGSAVLAVASDFVPAALVVVARSSPLCRRAWPDRAGLPSLPGLLAVLSAWARAMAARRIAVRDRRGGAACPSRGVCSDAPRSV